MNNNSEIPSDKLKFKEFLEKIDAHLLKIQKPSLLITSAQMSQTMIQSGIQSLYKDKIEFIHALSSPYSYVPLKDIDKALYLAQKEDTILVIKQQALNLVGSETSFKQLINNGSPIIVVNREIDALDVAIKNEDKNVIFFSVDYESNSPSLAGLILEADEKNIQNISVLVHNKILPPAIRNLLDISQSIDAYIAPGDLTILIGMQAWDFMPETYNIPVSIGGFTPLSLLKSIESVLNMLVSNYNSVINNYSDLVSNNGNPIAQNKTFKVFSPKTVEWQGFGLIPFSGLSFNPEYLSFDADVKFDFSPLKTHKQSPCIDVLKARLKSEECEWFMTQCTPETSLGSSMALENGICNIIYRSQSISIPDIKDYTQIIN